MVMRRGEKAEVINEVMEKTGQVSNFFLVDFRGLSVVEIQDLRTNLRKIDNEMRVVKNSLLDRALKKAGIEGFEGQLEGPTGIVWGGADSVESAKALVDFTKEHENLSIKSGFLSGTMISSEEVGNLAKLPPKPQLLAEVVGTLEAPISGLVFTLEGVISDFVLTLQAVVDKQQEAA